MKGADGERLDALRRARPDRGAAVALVQAMYGVLDNLKQQ